MQTAIDNILINYEIVNPHSPTTLIILHGWGRNLDDWEFIAANIPELKCVLVDLPGFGSSTYNSNLLTSVDYANLIKKLAHKLNLSKYSLLGHSFGGKVAALLATKTNISRLILVSASGTNEKTIFVKLKILVVKALKPLLRSLPPYIQTKLLFYLSSPDYISSGQLKPLLKNILKENIVPKLELINANTLIIWGSNDKTLPTSNSKIFRQNIQNSQIRIIWGAGHHPHLDKPNKFLEILKEFV